MEPLSLQVLVVVTGSFLGFQWLFHRGSPWVSQQLCKGFLRLSPTQRTEWNSRCQILSSVLIMHIILSLTKVGGYLFFLKGPSQQCTPWLWDFSVSTYISLMNPSRKTQSGEDLKMQSITNVVAQHQTVQSELELELELSQNVKV